MARRGHELAAPAAAATTRWNAVARVSSSVATRTGGALGVERGTARAQVALEVGGVAGGAADAMPGVRLTAVPVRACAATGRDLALRACALAEPLWVTGGTGDVTTLLGGSIAGTGRTVVDGVELIYQVGIDLHGNGVDYRWADQAVLTTPWLAVWTGLGVQWEGGP
ncbi:MAG: hypothetical protein H6708_17865 [Kofleriaceae bacterium]|nr:hypothetical protein [Kofleriaceae bacterium]